MSLEARAIKLTDGTVLSGVAETHLLLAEKLGISPEKIESKGFLFDGRYVPKGTKRERRILIIPAANVLLANQVVSSLGYGSPIFRVPVFDSLTEKPSYFLCDWEMEEETLREVTEALGPLGLVVSNEGTLSERRAESKGIHRVLTVLDAKREVVG